MEKLGNALLVIGLVGALVVGCNNAYADDTPDGRCDNLNGWGTSSHGTFDCDEGIAVRCDGPSGEWVVVRWMLVTVKCNG